MLVLASRLVLALLGGLGAFQAAGSFDLEAQFGAPWHYVATAGIVLVGALVGFIVGGLLGRWLSSRLSLIDRAADRRPAGELIVGAFGLVVGLLVAVLAGFAVLQLPTLGPYLLLPVVLLVAYVFSRIAARKHVDILRLVGIRPRGSRGTGPARIIDTSAIIDGRIVDVARSKFLSGQIVVPAIVLEELQQVADSSDPLKRARGRRGLELVDELKASANGGFQVREVDYPDIDEVDAKLVRLAQDLEASLVTTDFNLNKVAQIQGVEVLN
ncbi:MAG: PIN/TRAM domain-containing protein, partial [Thermoleophilia bacterium]|nr:PIN/TRAM domain-containing protein [Thermoleophilia bacterium]